MDLLAQFLTRAGRPQHTWPQCIPIEKTALPQSAALLTEPLLTPAVAHYYQRTPQIRMPLQIIEDTHHAHYYRAIVMMIDKCLRDDAIAADKDGQSVVVALGIISMQFSVIPVEMREDIQNSNIPFGTLLLKHRIKTENIGVGFFKLYCDEYLATILQCQAGTILYGRTNTLVCRDNQMIIAKVLDILSGASPV